MVEREGQRVRITLRWIKILDSMEPFFDDEGEFRFHAKITSGGATAETLVPEEGFYTLSDRPGYNFMELNKIIFEGDVASDLTVEIAGEEVDEMSANDALSTYRRDFTGSASEWYGVYKPHDEGGGDLEALDNWHLCYVIERA